ncbi:sulfotransferase domain-containing protein [Methylocaldum sp. MU1018]
MPDKKYVILAGSGRSGTTWLGSILDSYEKAEYFYEICHYPELDFTTPGLLRIKNPYGFWLPERPVWARRAERVLLEARAKYGPQAKDALRSLRINKDYGFKKSAPDTYLFKIVRLLWFCEKLNDLKQSLGDNLKIVHLIRNPFSQLASELRQHARHEAAAEKRYRERVEYVLKNPALGQYHELAAKYLGTGWPEHMVLLWWISNELMLNASALPVLRVVYEDLCREPEAQVGKIFDFLGWPVSEQTLRHLRDTTGVAASEQGEWSIRKNAEESMTRWRKELSEDLYRRISAMVADCSFLDLWRDTDLVSAADAG